MMFDTIDYRSIDDIELDTKRRFKEIAQKRTDIDFYEELIAKDYLQHINSLWSFNFPYTAEFYRKVANKNTNALDTFEQDLKHVTSNNITNIGDFTWVGLNDYGFSCRFTFNDNTYSFEIPLRANIRISDIYQAHDLRFELGKFKLCIQESRSVWKYVWSGWNCDDTLKAIFKE